MFLNEEKYILKNNILLVTENKGVNKCEYIIVWKMPKMFGM